MQQRKHKHHKYSDGGGMFSRLASSNWRAQQDDQTRVKRRRADCKQVLTLTSLRKLNLCFLNCFYFQGFTPVWGNAARRLPDPLVFIAASTHAPRAERKARPKARPWACTRRKTFFPSISAPKKMESITLCHSGPINSSHLSSRSLAPFFSPFN